MLSCYVPVCYSMMQHRRHLGTVSNHQVMKRLGNLTWKAFTRKSKCFTLNFASFFPIKSPKENSTSKLEAQLKLAWRWAQILDQYICVYKAQFPPNHWLRLNFSVKPAFSQNERLLLGKEFYLSLVLIFTWGNVTYHLSSIHLPFLGMFNFHISMFIQFLLYGCRCEHVAKGLISIVRDGKSGSVWLIANEKPPKEVPYSSVTMWMQPMLNQQQQQNHPIARYLTHQIKTKAY